MNLKIAIQGCKLYDLLEEGFFTLYCHINPCGSGLDFTLTVHRVKAQKLSHPWRQNRSFLPAVRKLMICGMPPGRCGCSKPQLQSAPSRNHCHKATTVGSNTTVGSHIFRTLKYSLVSQNKIIKIR